MKLCFVVDTSTIHTQRWVRYFISSGHEVHLISFNRSNRPKRGSINGAKLHVLNQFPLRLKIFSSMINLAFGAIQVRKLLKEIRPDILHAHYITDNGIMAAMTGFHPLVLSAWGSDILIDPKRSLFLKKMIKYVLRKADQINYNSETLERAILELGASQSKLGMIYHGVDTELFSPLKRDEGLKRELGISAAPTVICIRELFPIYNVEMFIKAIPLILKEVPEARFIISGEGDQKKYLIGLAESLGVSGAISFTGYMPLHEDIARHLASSDVYVSTSLSDSTAVSLLEAMACELAPVITDLPANREWITHGQNGFLVPVGDFELLASNVVYLLNNKETREKFGKACRKMVIERAEYRKEMGKMETVYQELIGQGKKQ